MAEMVQQPVEVPVPLQLFGGLVTEMSPSDLPEGISPDCQDIVFFPGGISSRPAAQKWLSGFLTAGTTVTYQKTFVTPWGAIKNLFLLSNGQLYVQDSSNPNVVTLLDTVAPGSYASSVSAFGKEYIVFHNNVNGTDIPRIYDGTYLDRVSQCGPGAPPVVASTILAPSTMAASGAAPTTAITSITPSDYTRVGNPPNTYYVYYASITIVVASTVGILVGQRVSVAGNTNGTFNINWGVTQVVNSTTIVCGANLAVTTVGGTGGTLTIGTNSTAIRNNNTVNVTTATAHGLQTGFQVQISDLSNEVVGGTISSIIIDNEINPGLATFTMAQAHGLLPGNVISVLGVPNTAVGGAITGAVLAAQIATITTTSAHGLLAGASVLIAGVSNAIFDGQFVILDVPTTTSFTYSLIDSDVSSTGGTVAVVWPVSNTSIIPNYFTVVAAPTPTTFTVQINYNDATWTGGTVTFSWNGTFFVTAVLSATSFQYQQYGPNATSSDDGLVTPYSQIAPGIRSCVVMFQTRQGLVTAPSPPVQFVSNGGQYLTISNIPIGPPDTIARIIAFTGADGANFFYIPNPGFVNGITVSTATQVTDNITTSILVDFSDLTLFDSTAIDIPGNNLFELGVLGPCLGVAAYASRAAWFGMTNDISNFINLGFEGGFISGSTNPLGWTVENSGGELVDTSYGMAWQISGNGAGDWGWISQGCYRDINNVPILLPITEYTVRMKLTLTANGGRTGAITAQIYSPSIGTIATAQIPTNTLILNEPGLYSFELPALPSVIPTDAILQIFGSGLAAGDVVLVDDIEVFPTLEPEVTEFLWSYVNLPDSLDLESGFLGATDDDTAIQCTFTYRGSFLFLTQFGLHETSDLAGYEPDGWVIREVARNCGACGPKAITTGENFSAWVTSPSSQPPVGRGLYLYTGGAVYKLSQEIQPDFDSVNPAAQQCIWVTNDAINRRMYLGLPLGTATAPNNIYVLDYREMDTAAEIASKSPIHISFTGKMICSDLSRKWTRWTIAANCGEIMTIPGVGVQFSIGAGNGEAPGTSPGYADCYWFNPAKYTDDDYGQITPYYTTYFFVNHELEQALQVGAHRKLYKRYSIYIQGLGYITISPYGNTLTNPWPPTPSLTLSTNQTYDLGDGLNVIAERCAFKIGSSPLLGQSDNWFNLGKFIVTMMQEPVAPIRFGAV